MLTKMYMNDLDVCLCLCLLQASVDSYRNYRHVTWYTLFIVLYMLVLYFQVRHMAQRIGHQHVAFVSCQPGVLQAALISE
jgi:hypothetical protein